jgi:isoleucyl-tRNA synthetase
MKKTRELVSLGLMARTKENISVKQPLLSVSFRESLPKEYEALVEDELNVKSVLCNKDQTEEVILDTTITEELKKEGDIRKLIRAVQDARKEASLVASDVITLTISEDIGDFSSLLTVCKVGRVVVDPAVSSVSVELSSKTVLIAVAKE